MAHRSVELPGQAQDFLASSYRRLARLMRGSSHGNARRAALAEAEVILEHHLQLDAEIDRKLAEVVEETESSALAVMQQVRQLHDTATRLVAYLDGTSLEAGSLGKEIVDSVAFLVSLGAFIEQLPAKMERDLNEVQSVAKEINELNGLTEAVQAISMQSHILAINAAIEATRAGNGGTAFRVVADEMRTLASNSSEVALKITQGLARARHAVEHGMASAIQESKLQLKQVSAAAASIDKLRGNFKDMSQYFNTRIGVVTQHNESLVQDITEVLGQMQTQDVVRQRIERIRGAITQRNVLLQGAFPGLAFLDGVDAARLAEELALVLGDYRSEESKHRPSDGRAQDSSAELKIELF